MFIETLVSELLAAETAQGLHALARRRRFLVCRLRYPNKPIRISFSGLLRIRRGGDYLLIRNLHRPESVGPLGGVFKYYESASETLDRLEFRPQVIGADMVNDLRGFLPRKHLGQIVRWFQRGHDRESPIECVCRELKEELGEIGASHIDCPPTLRLKLVRSVAEGPARVPGHDYTQFRIFDIFDIDRADEPGTRFVTEISGANHADLIWASDLEITTGRARGNQIIGHHAAYLFSRRSARPESPPFVHA